MSAPKLTALATVMDARNGVVEVDSNNDGEFLTFQVEDQELATWRSILRIENAVRITVEPATATATAPSPPRPAVEVAREIDRLADDLTERSVKRAGAASAKSGSNTGIRRGGEADGLREAASLVRERAASVRATQSSDLAGRIRALIQEYAGRWADAPSYDDLCACRETMQHLRQACWVAKNGLDVEQRIRERVEWMRDSTSPEVRQAADELETIVRESAEAP